MSKGLAIGAGALLLASLGCSEEPSATAPKAQDLPPDRAAVAQKATSAAPTAAAGTPAADAPDVVNEETSGENVATLVTAYRYQAEGKRDPFRPFRIAPSSTERELGGPLEQFELEQLEVVGVVWSANKPRALVSDPAGGTYVVGVETKMGKNNGRVIHIGDNLVRVKETYVDFAGERTTKDVELRIRGNQGG